MLYQYRARIIRVVDGDTVDVDIDLGFGIWKRNERVRLQGVDTPESRTRDETEKRFGKLAAAYVLSALPVSSWQLLATQKDQAGKFGRTLARFLLPDGRVLNDLMIRDHVAVAYHGQSKDDVLAQHLANRTALIEASTGDAEWTPSDVLSQLDHFRSIAVTTDTVFQE